MKVVMAEPLGISAEYLEELADRLRAKGHEFVAYDSVEKDVAKLTERCCDADILIIANNPLPDAVIEACPKLKYISVAFVGIDHVGKKTCRVRNIPVSNAAGYCNDAVAELALGLTLDCLRNVSVCNSVIREGGSKAGLIGHELHGKTVGIIGTGGIGCTTAKLFKAFGCRVLGYSRHEREEAKAIGVEYRTLDELLAESDIVSVHTPLTDATKSLIDAEKLALMKDTAILINTARGPVVDQDALAEALNAGKLAAAGIDVYDVEPPLAQDHVILTAKNVVCTPHVGFATKESIDRRAAIVFENIHTFLAGNPQNVMSLE